MIRSILSVFKAVYTFQYLLYRLHNERPQIFFFSILFPSSCVPSAVTQFTFDPLLLFSRVFFSSATPPLSSSSCCWRETPAQDASEVLAPRSLPAAPPAPAHRHKEVGEGQRPQGGQAQTHEGQVRVFTLHANTFKAPVHEGHSFIPGSLHHQGEGRGPSRQVGTLQARRGWLLWVHRVSRGLRRLPGQAPRVRPNVAHVVQAAQASPPGTEPHQNPPRWNLLWIREFNQSGPAAEPDLSGGRGGLPGPDTPHHTAAAAQPPGDTQRGGAHPHAQPRIPPSLW